MQTILIIEDDDIVLDLLDAQLSSSFNLLKATNILDGLNFLRNKNCDVIIVDLHVPKLEHGVEFLDIAIKEYQEKLKIVLTGFDDVIDAFSERKVYRLQKPYSMLDLMTLIKRALEMNEFYELKMLTEHLKEPPTSIDEFDSMTAVLEKRNTELSILKRIADIVLSVPDKEMYGEVLDVVLEITESDVGGFGYIEEKTGEFVEPSLTRHIWEKCQVEDKDIRFSVESFRKMPTWGRVFYNHEVSYSNSPLLQVPEGHIDINRALMVPIMFRGELIGIIAVANKEDDYSATDIEVMSSITNHIAPILNARLQRDGIRANDK